MGRRRKVPEFVAVPLDGRSNWRRRQVRDKMDGQDGNKWIEEEGAFSSSAGTYSSGEETLKQQGRPRRLKRQSTQERLEEQQFNEDCFRLLNERDDMIHYEQAEKTRQLQKRQRRSGRRLIWSIFAKHGKKSKQQQQHDGQDATTSARLFPVAA